jgi:PAS domain S-box-containing protein
MQSEREISGFRSAQGEAVGLDGVAPYNIEILDAVDLPIILIRGDCTIADFNRSATAAFRLNRSAIGQTVGSVFAAVENLDSLCREILTDGTPRRQEISERGRTFLLRIAPYTAGEFNVAGALLTFTNVTAFRASIEQAIYEREYTKAILNTVIDPLIVLDADLRVQTANRAFYSMFGVSRDESQSVAINTIGDDTWKGSSVWDSIKKTLFDNVEFQPVEIERSFPAIGRRTIVLDARRLARDGEALILLAFQDITERKKAQEAVRQRTAQFQTLLNEAPLGVYLVDGELRIREANPTALRFFENVPDLVGRDFNEAIRLVWPKAYADEIISRFRRTLGTGEPCFVPERVSERLDNGAREFYEWQINRIQLPNGGFGVVCYFRDISAVVSARRAIVENESRYRDLFDYSRAVMNNMGEGLYTVDTEGLVTFINPAAEKMFGWTRAELLGKRMHDLTHYKHPDGTLFPASECAGLQVLKDGKLQAHEDYFIRKDGSIFPVVFSAAPLKTEGKTVGVVVAFRDETERRKTETALRESEDRFRALTNASSYVVYRMSPDWSEMRHLQGRSFVTDTEESTHNWLDKYVYPDDQTDMTAVIHEAIRTKGIFEFEHRVRRADGSIGWTLSRAIPLLDPKGEIVEWFGAASDVTQRKLAEEGIAADLAAMRRLHEISTGLIGQKDLATLLGEVLDAAIEITGADMGNVQLLDTATKKLKIFVQRGFEKPFLNFFDSSFDGLVACGTAMQNGRRVIVEDVANNPLFDAESRKVMLAAGALAVQSTPFVTRFGKFLGVFSTHYRSPRTFDERILRLLDLLARQAADLIERQSSEQELQRINYELRRSNEDLNQFAFAASHDLQEPLRMITSYSQLLLKGYRGELDGEATLCVDFITEGSQRMRELLADLLAYTQVNNDSEEPELVDLNMVFGKEMENLKAAIEETEAVVTQDKLPRVKGREAHFLQLFQNLIGNAIKYRADRPPRIHLGAAKSADDWLFSVADNGIGIEPEYHESIFGVFKRLHGREISGTGIGLAICQRAVERYGGRIWVESQLGHGSTFYFTIPAGNGDGVVNEQ